MDFMLKDVMEFTYPTTLKVSHGMVFGSTNTKTHSNKLNQISASLMG